ncbi:MAG: heme exporter protein CcmD [Proteobacteria bacterium]|nr:heme exporter protein CcmD [Pseudomonadota bacterium]
MADGTYIHFVWAAYGVTGIILAAIVLMSILKHRSLKKENPE